MAAAIAALPHEAIASGRRECSARRSASAARRWSRIATRCRPLWLPPTLPVSSFTHTSPPTAADTTSDRENGVTANPSARSRVNASQACSVIPLARANAHHPSRGP